MAFALHTFAVGDPLTAAQMNQHEDNFTWLKGRDFCEKTFALNGSAALTTSHRAKYRIASYLNGMNLVEVAANCGTDGSAGSSSSGIPTFTIQNGTTNMLSTNLTIDQGEYDSSTAATPAVIDTSHDDVATGNIINTEVTVSGTGVTYAIITHVYALP
jgi:hypothetical protein